MGLTSVVGRVHVPGVGGGQSAEGSAASIATAAIPARLLAVPLADVLVEWTVIVNLLAGSLAGAWLGATWATRMRAATLYRVLGALLVGIALVFAAEHGGGLVALSLPPLAQAVTGLVAGFGVGVVAAVMGVAGGELLIPTIVLLYGVDTETGGQPVAARVPADNARCLLPLQQGSGLHGARAAPRLRRL